jgi:hypothetical protein
LEQVFLSQIFQPWLVGCIEMAMQEPMLDSPYFIWELTLVPLIGGYLCVEVGNRTLLENVIPANLSWNLPLALHLW